MDCTPIPKPKRRPKSKRDVNPQKADIARLVDPQAVEDAKRDYCIYCDTRSGPFIVHHVRTVGSGGPDADWNLANLCLKHEREAHHGQIKKDVLFCLIEEDLKRCREDDNL